MASPESREKTDRHFFPLEKQPAVLNLLREIVYNAIKNNQPGAVYLTRDNQPLFIELQTELEYRDLACSGVLTPAIKLGVIPESYGPPLDYITDIFIIGGRSVFPTECFITSTSKTLYTVISGNNGDDLIISRGRISRDKDEEVRIQRFREIGRISQREIDEYAYAAESSGY